PSTIASVLNNIGPVLGQSEVQTVSFSGSLSGVFFLTLNGQFTQAIPYNNTNGALVANVQNALDALLGTGNTLVRLSPTSGGQDAVTKNFSSPILTVTFTGALAGANVPTLGTVVPSGAGTGTITAAGVTDGSSSIVQQLNIGGTNNGKITLSFGGI